MRPYLSLAPLQSFTDHHFRNAFQQVLGDVDRFYAPYLKMNNDGTIKNGPKTDVLPENNPYEPVVPQVMACNADDFLLMAEYLTDLGYQEINWNMGCPYPMVAKRNLGSGILDKPEMIFAVLDKVIPHLKARLGIKMRMGYENTQSILDIFPALDHYPLEEIIVHARYGKQLYTGTCDHDRFEESIPLTRHRLVYNGDINTVEEFRYLSARFPSIQHWMIGRGAIANPFLFEMIQEDDTSFPDDWKESFQDFLELLLESHLDTPSVNPGNILLKMQHYWEYFANGIEEGSHYCKAVKKMKNLSDYTDFLSIFAE